MRKLWTFVETPLFSKIPHHNVPFTSFPMLSFYSNVTIDETKMLSLAISMKHPKDTATLDQIVLEI